MNHRLLAGLAGVATAVLAFATAAQPAPSCFNTREVANRTVGGPHTLYFDVKDRSHLNTVAYIYVETKRDCHTVESSGGHGGFQVESAAGPGGRPAMICKPADIAIVPDPDAGRTCPVATIERMLPQEVAALPPGIRPGTHP